MPARYDIEHARPADLPTLKLDYKAIPLNIIVM
jgi:hypothetical protein